MSEKKEFFCCGKILIKGYKKKKGRNIIREKDLWEEDKDIWEKWYRKEGTCKDGVWNQGWLYDSGYKGKGIILNC